MREVTASPRKAKCKNKLRISEAARDAQPNLESLVQSAPNTPFRAPGPPRTMMASKRKSGSAERKTSPGKLCKIRKTGQQVNEPSITRRGDINSYPRSPTEPLDLARPLSMLRTQRGRENTYDTDRTYMPRRASADTETVIDSNDAAQAERGEPCGN